jgi:poly(A) polymerase
MVLLPPDEAVIRQAAARLRLPNAVRDRLAFAVQALPGVGLGMGDREARAALYRHNAQAVSDAIRWRWAEAPDQADEARRLLKLADGWTRPSLPVGGRDLARLGVTPGPETGRLLKAFEAGWIADDFPVAGHAERLAALVSARRG